MPHTRHKSVKDDHIANHIIGDVAKGRGTFIWYAIRQR